MVGANAGAYSYPTNGFDTSFNPSYPPYWLPQLMALSHGACAVHTLGIVLDNGTLLAGPSLHGMSQDQPAYEFTNNAADPYLRVMVRKMNNTNLWLACAWAQDGSSRNATVTIPTAGTVTCWLEIRELFIRSPPTASSW